MDANPLGAVGSQRDPHISAERLAALADEPSTAAEAHHLATCSVCAAEVQAYCTLLELARTERDRLGEPLTRWPALEAALGGMGTLDAAPRLDGTAPRRQRPHRLEWARNAVAAAMLLAMGTVIGRLSAARSDSPLAGHPVQIASIQGTDGAVRAVSNTAVAGDTEAFGSKSDALRALQQAEDRYRRAAAYLMFADSSAPDESTDGYRTRLAALDEVAQTTRAALRIAPNDPVLNQWYMSSVGARQATLRQLGQALPQGQKLRGF
jgi:hypothetical protein